MPNEALKAILYDSIRNRALITEETNHQIFKNLFVKKNYNFSVKKKTIIKNISNIRKRNENLSTTNDIIPFKLLYTYKNKLFARSEEEYDGIIYYFTHEFITYLIKSEIWCRDGTFLSAPKNFSQLYIIHGKYLGIFIPLIYILMRDRTEISYKKLFKKLKSFTREKEPNYFVSDNEKAQVNAFKSIFTTTKTFFCLTHFSNNVFCSIRKYALLNLYNIDFQFKCLVGMLESLIFLPKQKLNKTIIIIRNEMKF